MRQRCCTRTEQRASSEDEWQTAYRITRLRHSEVCPGKLRSVGAWRISTAGNLAKQGAGRSEQGYRRRVPSPLSCCRAKRGFERVGGDPARRPPRRGFLLQKLYAATFCSVSRRCKVGGSPGGTRRRRGHMRHARRAASLRATCAKGWREAYLIRELLRAEEASGRARNPEPGEHPENAQPRRAPREPHHKG